MQERPSKQVLLTAIARFLTEEARPALADPRLAFRALIAANLASIVASELASDGDLVTAELTRLRALFADPPTARAPLPPRLDDQRAEVAELEGRLARLLREGSPSEEALARIAEHLRATLREKLGVDNPRFDTSMDIE